MKNVYSFLIILLFVFAFVTVDAKSKKKNKNKNKIGNQQQVDLVDGCAINLPRDIPKNEPVYVSTSGKFGEELYRPIGNKIVVKTNETLAILCPTKNNKIVNDYRSSMTLKCIKGHTFEDADDGLQYDITRLNCTKKVVGDLEDTGKSCGGGLGRSYNIGFKFPGKFLTLIESCYDYENGSAIYSQHVINGIAVKYSVRESDRRAFSALGTTKGLKPYQLYTRQYQKELFEDEFGIEFDDRDSEYFLSRGHLSPDGDFVFSSEQFATYFYLNVAPQFQVVNSGNILRVEKLARKLASTMKSDLRVVTGTFGVLRMRDNQTGRIKPMFLDSDNKRIAVPAWFYKILFDPASSSNIVFITSNNPFAESKIEVPEICPNICADAGVTYKTALNDFTKGYTYCCDLKDFRQKVKTIPDDFLQLKSSQLLNLKNLRF